MWGGGSPAQAPPNVRERFAAFCVEVGNIMYVEYEMSDGYPPFEQDCSDQGYGNFQLLPHPEREILNRTWCRLVS